MVSPPDIEQLCVVLTAQCNLRCRYCYQTVRRPGRMSWDTLKTSIDLLVSSPRRNVKLVFLGGEPLLEFALLKRGLEYLRSHRPSEKRVRASVVTNGTCMTDEVAACLALHGVETHLSFDGVRRSQDVRHAGSFDVLDGLVDRLRERHPDHFRRNLSIAVTLTPGTVADLAESVDYFLGKGVRTITITPTITPCPGWRPGDIDGLDAQFARITESSLRHFDRTGQVPLRVMGEETASPQPRSDRMMCAILPNDSPGVDVDGRIYACPVFAESYQDSRRPLLREATEAMRLGTLTDPGWQERHERFPDVVAGLAMFTNKERKHSSYRRCSECEHVDSCMVCPAAIGHLGDDPDRIPDFTCAYNLVSLKHRARYPSPPSLSARVRGEPLHEQTLKWKRIAEVAGAARRQV